MRSLLPMFALAGMTLAWACGCHSSSSATGKASPAAPSATVPTAESAVQAPTSGQPAGPIPITVKLKEPGFVTLVIEDSEGRRVRNLISETPLPAGTNTLYWDGLDDLRRDGNAASHGVYHIPGSLVAPGSYTVRGLRRKAVDLVYEFTVYNPGAPPWHTAERTSEWLTNHTPPGTICFIPAGAAPVRAGQTDAPAQVLIGSYVAEGGSGLAWVDLDGHKRYGQMWVGGVWTGAELIARDTGDKALPGVYAYVASSWKGDKYNDNQSELRLHKLVNDTQRLAAPRDQRFGTGEDPAVLKPTWKFPAGVKAEIGGLAARNGLVLVSLTAMDALLVVDVAQAKTLGTMHLPAPRGLAFDASGQLLAVSGKQVVRLTLPPADKLGQELAPVVLVAAGIQEPQQIALDAACNLYVTDRGASNQVKVFTPDGKPLRAIGTAGIAQAGPYDPTLMHNPKGLAVDDRAQLWVAEDDFQPKRVSVWSLDGKLLRAFYGPPIYGGGGVLDPQDKTLFHLGGMTFKLDWATGESRLTGIRYRPGPKDFQLPRGPHADGPPDTPIYTGGRTYYTNCFSSSPTGGTPVVCLWRDQRGVAVPAAAFGRAEVWEWLKDDAFKGRIPADPKRPLKPGQAPSLTDVIFVWSDVNGDGVGQPEEVTLQRGTVASGVTVAPDLSLVTGKAVRYAPQRFTPAGVPVYDLEKGEALCPDTQSPTSSGGGQVLMATNGWTVLTTAPKPFAPQSVGGARNGAPFWSYPSPWPGLHASHIAPPPEFPGEVIGTTRLLGPSFTLDTPAHDELWAINGNKGSMYLFTTDGLFVATLFQDTRTPNSSWATELRAVRGMSVKQLTNNEESFWPSITKTGDGKVYIVSNWPAIIRVDGLDSLRRLPSQTLTITPTQLAAARDFQVAAELKRQAEAKTQTVLPVPIMIVGQPPVVDGDLKEWKPAGFVTIDVRQKQVGDWGRRKQETQAALAVAGDRLYAAFRTGEPNALDNAATSLPNLFKTGGALDLMLGTDPQADPKRARAVAGDLRLLVAMEKGKPIAVLYRPVVPGATGDGVPFGSPLRTIRFAEVRDVSADVVLARGTEKVAAAKDKPASTGPSGDFEFSIPLTTLGLKPALGLVLRGDVGILRGSGIETTQRAYWSNKASGITADIPSEAELTPRLWGELRFAPEP